MHEPDTGSGTRNEGLSPTGTSGGTSASSARDGTTPPCLFPPIDSYDDALLAAQVTHRRPLYDERAVAALSDVERVVVFLRIWKGMSWTQIAMIVPLSPTSIRTMWNSLLVKLAVFDPAQPDSEMADGTD